MSSAAPAETDLVAPTAPSSGEALAASAALRGKDIPKTSPDRLSSALRAELAGASIGIFLASRTYDSKKNEATKEANCPANEESDEPEFLHAGHRHEKPTHKRRDYRDQKRETSSPVRSGHVFEGFATITTRFLSLDRHFLFAERQR